MTPSEIARNAELLARFQDELAYADRARPTQEEVRMDGELLRSSDGILVVAWLWPELIYLSERDPFADVERQDRAFWQRIAADTRSVDFQQSFEQTEAELDRLRQQRRGVASDRFARITDAISVTLGCSIDDVMTHLLQATPLSPLGLEALQRGHTPLAFSMIVSVCHALQLQFADFAWELVDPQRLARRIKQSGVANAIAHQLAFLPLSSLESLARKVPKGSVEAGEGREFEAYSGPLPGGRYRSLFDAFAVDLRDDPEYTLEQIDRLLTEAGEDPLPKSAKFQRSWWAGSGTKSAGRPQVSAWWGAGYRVGNVVTPLRASQIESIIFRALPGRHAWLSDPNHAASGEYPPTSPETASIFPDISALADVLVSFGRTISDLAKSTEPDDPAILSLVQFLRSSGEVDRDAIKQHFADADADPDGAQVDASWLSNLLTRARRQGWIVNNGTRSNPRWTTT